MKVRKRIMCIAAAVLILFGCIGGPVSFKAADSDSALSLFFQNRESMIADSSVLDGIELPDEALNSTYWAVFKSPSGLITVYYSDDVVPIFLDIKSSVENSFYLNMQWNIGVHKQYYSNSSWNTTDDTTTINGYTFGVISSDDVFSDDYIDYVASNYGLDYGIYKFFGYEEFYSSELGYLNNIDIRLLKLTDSSGNVDVYSGLYRILFDSLSTTGVDLTQGNYFVRVYGQCAIYDKDWDLVSPDMPLIFIGDADIGLDPTRVEYYKQAFFDAVTEGTGQDVIDAIYTAWNINFNGYLRRDTVYLQICKINDDASIEYGGFTKLAVQSVDYATLEDTYVISTVTPDLDQDDSGYSGEVVEEQIGHGTSYDDGNLDIEENGGVTDSGEDFVNSVNTLLNMIGAFPNIIGTLFSFLPPWCLQIAGIAFAVLVIVFFIKLAT